MCTHYVHSLCALTLCTHLTVCSYYVHSLLRTHCVRCRYLADPECSLSSLYIYGNCVACAGAVALGEALKTNTKLEKLTLTQNYIGAAGGEGLVGALASNSKLQMLALGMNPVGDRTAIAVAKLIQVTRCSVQWGYAYCCRCDSGQYNCVGARAAGWLRSW